MCRLAPSVFKLRRTETKKWVFRMISSSPRLSKRIKRLASPSLSSQQEGLAFLNEEPPPTIIFHWTILRLMIYTRHHFAWLIKRNNRLQTSQIICGHQESIKFKILLKRTNLRCQQSNKLVFLPTKTWWKITNKCLLSHPYNTKHSYPRQN